MRAYMDEEGADEQDAKPGVHRPVVALLGLRMICEHRTKPHPAGRRQTRWLMYMTARDDATSYLRPIMIRQANTKSEGGSGGLPHK